VTFCVGKRSELELINLVDIHLVPSELMRIDDKQTKVSGNKQLKLALGETYQLNDSCFPVNFFPQQFIDFVVQVSNPKLTQAGILVSLLLKP
jgi:hypothetical protein